MEQKFQSPSGTCDRPFTAPQREENVSNRCCHRGPLERFISTCGVFVALGFLAIPSASQAAVRVVDLDGQASETDCGAANVASSSIQEAVNLAAPGDTILVCPGTYNEQVVIPSSRSNLTIRGSGAGVTIIRPDTVVQNSNSILLGVPVKAIIVVDGTSGVTIASLTVDGSAADGGANPTADCSVVGFYLGIFQRQGSGAVSATRISGMRSTTTCGIGIRAENANLLVTTSLIDTYNFGAIMCVGLASTCTITGNAIRGLGRVTDQGQAGIHIRAQAAGVISGNTITDHFLIGAKGTLNFSVGIFLAAAQPSSNPHLERDNVFANNQLNVQRQATASTLR
jgi:Periplasmic copper-binding protein (NosD)